MTVALSLLAVAAVVAGRLHVLLQILQQEHYENARLYRWVRRDLRRLAPLVAAAVLAGGVLADRLGVIAAAAALAAAVRVRGADVAARPGQAAGVHRPREAAVRASAW